MGIYDDGHRTMWGKVEVFSLFFNDVFYKKYSNCISFCERIKYPEQEYSYIHGFSNILKEGVMCTNENEVIAYGNYEIGDMVDYGDHKAKVVGIMKRCPNIENSYYYVVLAGKILMVLNPGYIQAYDDYMCNLGNDYYSIYIPDVLIDEIPGAPHSFLFDKSKIEYEDVNTLEMLGKVTPLRKCYSGANSFLVYLSVVYLIACLAGLIIVAIKLFDKMSKKSLITGYIVSVLPMLIMLDCKPFIKYSAIMSLTGFAILTIIKGVRHEIR